MIDTHSIAEAYEAGRKVGIDEERAAVVRYLDARAMALWRKGYDGSANDAFGAKFEIECGVHVAHGLADDIEAGQHAARGAQGNTGEVE